jgi:hypothetical protein
VTAAEGTIGSAGPGSPRRGRIAPVPRSRALAYAAGVVGLVLIAIAIVYWVEPAKSLPSFFPGHAAGSAHHHVKHGVAAFLVGLALLAYAWFGTGEPRARTPA